MYYSKKPYEIGHVSRRAAKKFSLNKNIGARECRKSPLVFIQPQFSPENGKSFAILLDEKIFGEKSKAKVESIQSLL